MSAAVTAAARGTRLFDRVRSLGRVNERLDPARAGTFDASVRAMQYWCRLNDGLVLERSKGTRLFVGFERLSRSCFGGTGEHMSGIVRPSSSGGACRTPW